MMKKGLRIFIPAVLVIFVPLLIAFFLGGYGQSLIGHELPIILGLFAYSLLLIEILLSNRPKVFERVAGLQNLYAIHGFTAILVLLTVVIHIGTEITKITKEAFPFPTVPLGVLGFLGLIVATLAGVLHLSVTFIGRFPKLMHKKNHSHKRERALWLHRLSLVSTLLLFGHIVSIPAIRENIVFSILLSVYVVLIMAYYVWTKIKNSKATHILNSVETVTSNVYKLGFIPVDEKQLTYRAGQYVFVCFTNSALPKERHPFSIVNAPNVDGNSLTVLAKQVGDYTEKLKLLKGGEKVAIEGPYGHFWNPEVAQEKNPIVLIAGGIGITPLLSILEEQLALDSNRPIHFIWGAATILDTFYLEIFHKLAQDHSNFKFNLILSKEKHPSYSYGLIDSSFLESIDVKPLYPKADIFVCGPTEMMSSIESILIINGVEPSRIHIEKFSF